MNSNKNRHVREDLQHRDLVRESQTKDTADSGISRRGFLRFAVASLFLARADKQVPQSESRNGIPYRTLGRSGEKVSLIGLGGYHLGKH
jgi:hypothetical protein